MRWVALLVVAALAGCATAQMASSASDADAKTFSPPAGKANLYVARSGDPSSSKARFNIAVDGKPVGPIPAGTFYLVVLNPGSHTLAASSPYNVARAAVPAEAGRNYFFEVTAADNTISSQVRLGLVLVEEMGKVMVRQNKRAQGPGD